jgi:hypothetical protein
MRFASDTVPIAIHVLAIPRLSTIDRERPGGPRIVAATPGIAGLRFALAFQTGRYGKLPRLTDQR